MAISVGREVRLGKAGRAFHFMVKKSGKLDKSIYDAGIAHEQASYEESTFAGRIFANLKRASIPFSEPTSSCCNGHAEGERKTRPDSRKTSSSSAPLAIQRRSAARGLPEKVADSADSPGRGRKTPTS